ncbi:MAG: SRPBCC domain-containing protein, partial [Polyangiaceae bacterium]
MPKIHQEVKFAAPPAKVYQALMSSAEHAKFTGAPAEISAKAGGAWSAYGGKIGGFNVELVDGTRIVQTWRA